MRVLVQDKGSPKVIFEDLAIGDTFVFKSLKEPHLCIKTHKWRYIIKFYDNANGEWTAKEKLKTDSEVSKTDSTLTVNL